MKPISPELIALLATRQFYVADIYTITLAGGTVLRYCGGDQDLTVNGNLYTAGGQVGPYFDRQENKATCHQKLGLQADTLSVDIIPRSAQVEGAPFMTAVLAGSFDRAEVLLERVFMPTYGDTRRGTVRWFLGQIAEIDGGSSVCTMTVNSHLELLNQQLPRNLYQVGCVNNLGDSICQATVPSQSGTVVAGSDVATVYGSMSAFPAGAFDLGKITFTSGGLSGVGRTIRSASPAAPNSTIAILGFLPAAPAAGDTFTISYGCNKSLTDSNGCPKFSNQAHFRGEPYTPQPDTAA